MSVSGEPFDTGARDGLNRKLEVSSFSSSFFDSSFFKSFWDGLTQSIVKRLTGEGFCLVWNVRIFWTGYLSALMSLSWGEAS